MIQTRFDIQNDACDETMLGIVACLNIVADCAACFADRETAEHIHHVQHCINAIICSCMLTQQCLELRRIETDMVNQPYQGPPAYVYSMLPPNQQQMVDASQALRNAPQQPFLQAGVQQQAPVLVAQGREVRGLPTRQITVQVPAGTVPGQMIQFQTPDGIQCTAVVPAGMAPGQTFVHYY